MIDFNSLVAPPDTRPKMYQSHWSGAAGVANSDDLRRIVKLPRRALELDGTERAQAIIDTMTARFTRGPVKCKCAQIDPDRHAAEGCLTELRLIQALALREIAICGGLVGIIGTGHGKTLLGLLAPFAFRAYGLSDFVLLLPPGNVTQLINDYEYVGQHFHMPQIIFHGNAYANTCNKMNSVISLERGAPTVHVVPYSRLSQPKATDWIENHLKPHAFIADEVHRLRNTTGAAANRVKRYMEDHPETRFAGWSGSITSRKVGDVAHIARWALRNASPLPHDDDNAKDWDRAVGAKGDPDYAGALLDLCEPGEQVRSGFRRRVLETVGVVSTSTPPVDCELRIIEYTPPPIPDCVRTALRGVRGDRPGAEGPERPDGEQLLDALSVNRVAMQVACGFYYKWIFPKCEFPRDEALVDEWREARKKWFCEVRQKLKTLEEHMDSPRLVQNAAERYWGDRPQLKGLPVWKSQHWQRWKAVRNTVVYDTEVVHLDDYLAKDVARIALETPQIIWYEHRAFGDWVGELSGLPVYGGGKDAKLAVLGDPQRGIAGEDGSRSIILSLDAFATGTNGLQRKFNKAGYPNPPSSPDDWEQSISRLVRIGQRAPSVDNWFVRHTRELKKHVDSALAAATYIEDGWGNQQKIVHGFELTEIVEDEEA